MLVQLGLISKHSYKCPLLFRKFFWSHHWKAESPKNEKSPLQFSTGSYIKQVCDTNRWRCSKSRVAKDGCRVWNLLSPAAAVSGVSLVSPKEVPQPGHRIGLSLAQGRNNILWCGFTIGKKTESETNVLFKSYDCLRHHLLNIFKQKGTFFSRQSAIFFLRLRMCFACFSNPATGNEGSRNGLVIALKSSTGQICCTPEWKPTIDSDHSVPFRSGPVSLGF